MFHTNPILRRPALPLALASVLLAVGCAPQKRTYTVPSVTQEIEGGIRQARVLKDRGKLKDASLLLQKVSKAVMEEYPQATLTQEPVKKLVDALEWIANLALDRSLELKNESVSSEEDGMSSKFAKWADLHREHGTKIRDLIPRLQKAPDPAPRPAAGGAPPPRPADARPGDARPGDARPGEPGRPVEPARPSEPGQPRPEEPPAGDGMEPG